MESSKDKVADGKTRDALSKQADAADKAKDSDDVKTLKDAQAALDLSLIHI